MPKNTPLQDFFFKHIKIIKRNKVKCSECGCALIGDFSEVAHVMPKSKFKSVAMENDNIIYLCGWKSENNCHGKLDNSSIETVREMKIYPKIQAAFKKLEGKIAEKLTWKDWDRYE